MYVVRLKKISISMTPSILYIHNMELRRDDAALHLARQRFSAVVQK